MYCFGWGCGYVPLGRVMEVINGYEFAIVVCIARNGVSLDFVRL